jgi:hypothetical protein
VKLYRVLPHDKSAAPSERGGALVIPPGGHNRLDNPDLYGVLYLAGDPEAAIAETFGRLPVWTPESFVNASGHPYALATYEVADDVALLSLDNVEALRALGITRPSRVVTRDRAATQAWARTIFQSGRYAGITWWSDYGTDWTVMGLRELSAVKVCETPQTITSTTAIVRETAIAIVRQIAR